MYPVADGYREGSVIGMSGLFRKRIAVGCIGFLAGVLAAILLPPLLVPLRARRLIESMESQEGGNYVVHSDRLIGLGAGAVPVLLNEGLHSENENVRIAVVGILDILGWEDTEHQLVQVFARIAEDPSESKLVRLEAVRAAFNHVGKPPSGWEPYIEVDRLRFKQIVKTPEPVPSASTMPESDMSSVGLPEDFMDRFDRDLLSSAPLDCGRASALLDEIDGRTLNQEERDVVRRKLCEFLSEANPNKPYKRSLAKDSYLPGVSSPSGYLALKAIKLLEDVGRREDAELVQGLAYDEKMSDHPSFKEESRKVVNRLRSK